MASDHPSEPPRPWPQGNGGNDSADGRPSSSDSHDATPRIIELEEWILSQEPWLMLSLNPIWPWQFGNAATVINTSDLRRITKGGPAPSSKMDNIAALVNALYCFDLTEGRVTE